MIIEPTHRLLLADNGLDSLDALFAVEGTRNLTKPGLPAWRERIRLELRDGRGRTQAFYLKRYTAPPIGQQLRRILSGRARRSAAWTEWRWMHALADAGIPAVQPVAYGEQMLGWWERRSALLTAEVPGQSLETWVERHPDHVRHDLLARVARLVTTFHARGLVHRDLYLSHIFIDESDPDGGELRLIDLQRVLRPRWRRRRWIIKDLAALNYSTPQSVASTTDRLRWLHLYLGVSKLRPPNKALVRGVVAKTRRIARHDRRIHGTR